MSNTPQSSPRGALISERQALLQLTDQQLAEAMGFTVSKVYTQIKGGTMKLPLGHVVALANALGFTVAELLTATLRAQAPALLNLIEEYWTTAALTDNEMALVNSFRTLAKGRDVTPLVKDGQSVIALVAA